MKKILVFLLVAFVLTFAKVSASNNTGQVPEGCFKLEFAENGSITNVEPSNWIVDEHSNGATISYDEVVITLSNYVFKDGEEIIGFTWSISGGEVLTFTVKHGTTVAEYGEIFTTSDEKGISNVVFCVQKRVIDDEEEDEEDDDEEVDEEEPDDEDEEEVDEEEEEEEDPEEEPEEEVEEEEDEEEDEEELPNTSDLNTVGLALTMLGAGLLILKKTQ